MGVLIQMMLNFFSFSPKSRGPAFTAFKMMREKRSDIFYETTGVLMEDGKKWHDIRSKGC